MAEHEFQDAEVPAGERRGLRHVLPFWRWSPTVRSHALEIIAALLLSVATIASAWSAYQATRWSGVQAIAFSQAAAARTESVRESDTASTLTAIDVGLFVQYVAAVSQRNTQLADFFEARFRPDFRRAFDAWLATKPLTTPGAPSSPFQMKEYVLPQAVEAARLQNVAEERTKVAAAANQRSDNYILTTVLFASVLFFAGVGTKFQSLGIRTITLLIGILVFVIGLGIVATFPVY
jgi:hypothetical protein